MRSDRWSGPVESDGRELAGARRSRTTKANDYSREPARGSRVSRRRLQELVGDLAERDLAILSALQTVRVLSGAQLERLLFQEVAASARGRVRRRVLGRLVRLGLVETLSRRVGGVRAGSAGLVYALSGAGARLLDLTAAREGPRRRGAYTPDGLFLAHSLAVSEVYVRLAEALRGVPAVRLEHFAVEAAARQSFGDGEVLRPDAAVVLTTRDVEDVWWLEVDRGTESLPRLAGMLKRYLAFAASDASGPRGVVPRVLISVEDEERLRALRGLIRRLPAPADELFASCLARDAAEVLLADLLGGEVPKPP